MNMAEIIGHQHLRIFKYKGHLTATQLRKEYERIFKAKAQ